MTPAFQHAIYRTVATFTRAIDPKAVDDLSERVIWQAVYRLLTGIAAAVKQHKLGGDVPIDE